MGNRTPEVVAARLSTDSKVARWLRPVVNRLLSDEPTVVVVRSGAARGLRMPIRPQEEKYYWTGDHEFAVQRTLISALSRGHVVWDIGAHIGFFTLIASRVVGPSGLVHAFEPLEANRLRLHEALRLNSAQNVGVHDAALGGVAGHANLYAHEFTTQWSLLRPRDMTAHVSVPVTTLEELGKTLSTPNLIKIDAEGAELEILLGGVRFLATSRPLLIVEFSSDALVDTARRALGNHDFEHIAGGHWLLRPM